MEPMTLGSPVGSPAAIPHAPPTGPTVGSPFLPSYLMGDVASPAAMSGRLSGGGAGGAGGGGIGGGTSPNKTTATRQFPSSTSVSTPGSPQPSKDPFFTSRLGPDKPGGGPPTHGLMGVRGTPTLPQSPIIPTRLGSPYVDQRILGTPIPCSPQTTQGTYYGSPGSPYTPQHTPGPLYGSPQAFTPSRDHHHHHSFLAQDSLQGTPRDSGGGGVEDSTWVTVFGFPPAAASYVLTQFTQLGTVTRHHNPGSGNWMHLKYQTKLQARKALSRNGKVYSGNIMIGVVTCNDKTIMGEKENLSTTSATVLSPAPTTPKANMRPLTQAYQTVHAEHEVVPKVSTPKKNDGLVSRAMQHLLGM